jgi:hypothetical protein
MPPARVLGLTFTKVAAAEIAKERGVLCRFC